MAPLRFVTHQIYQFNGNDYTMHTFRMLISCTPNTTVIRTLHLHLSLAARRAICPHDCGPYPSLQTAISLPQTGLSLPASCPAYTSRNRLFDDGTAQNRAPFSRPRSLHPRDFANEPFGMKPARFPTWRKHHLALSAKTATANLSETHSYHSFAIVRKPHVTESERFRKPECKHPATTDASRQERHVTEGSCARMASSTSSGTGRLRRLASSRQA